MKKLLLSTLPLLLLVSCSLPEAGSRPEASPDEAAITALVTALYQGIYVDEETLPDYAQLKSYFAREAKMGSVRNGQLSLRTAEEYIDRMQAGFSQQRPLLLEEWETGHRTEVFGHIAHRFSAYAVHLNTRDSIAEKGIMSIQLVKTNHQWKILSMIWDVEPPQQPLPAEWAENP